MFQGTNAEDTGNNERKTMATPTGWGNEFLVKTPGSDEDDYVQPTLTALPDGRFVIIWAEVIGTFDGELGYYVYESNIRGQLFNANGTKAGAEILVNTTTNKDQYEPTITALADGRFVVAWTDSSQAGGDSSSVAVRAQVFNADGTKAGAEFRVNTTTNKDQYEPTITALSDGRFVVAWTDSSQAGGDTSSVAVRAQVFNADGTKAGAEFLVNTTTSNGQYQPAIAALADGGFVIAWTDVSGTGEDASGSAVRAQVFAADGTPAGSECLVNTTTNNDQSDCRITALFDGRFVVTWTNYNETGEFVENEFGEFVSLDSSDLHAQIFNSDGTRAGDEFRVNTTSAGSQYQYSSTITSLADGGFVVAWTDEQKQSYNSVVRAQVFNTNGGKVGSELLVNIPPIFQLDYQIVPKITALADGRFLIAWSDKTVIQSAEDGGNTGIRARIFDPRTSAVELVGTLDNDDLIGTIFNDTLSGFFGDDKLRGAAGHDRIFGEEDNDALIGNAGNDLLEGAAGNDDLGGGVGSDRLFGGDGIDVLDGQAGNDLLSGGNGDDILVIDTLRDRVVEASGGGNDEVRSSTVSIDLSLSHLAQVENGRLIGTSALNLIGSSAANRLTGNNGTNIIRGNAGADILTGLTGADRFVLNDSLSADQITDFTSAADKLQLSQAGLPIGNGNTTIDGGLLRNAPGGFSNAAELVIFSTNIASATITTTHAAAAIGSASAAYVVGATRLFAVDNGSRSHLYRFRAADANALVAPSELTLLADLTGTPALALADLQFVL
jgi:Ca2+-binding RTX toxin-like protein